jgi:hypothetical protein
MKLKLIRESDVLREVCQYLKARNYFFTRLNNIPAPGRSMPKYTLKGLPDIIILWKGIMICVECKRPDLKDFREANGRTVRGGKLSLYQAEFASKIALNEGEYFCVHSAGELDKELQGLAIKYQTELPRPSYGTFR